MRRPVYSMMNSRFRIDRVVKTPRPWTEDLLTLRNLDAPMLEFLAPDRVRFFRRRLGTPVQMLKTETVTSGNAEQTTADYADKTDFKMLSR